jgi:Tfp pilus assembly protein PilN
MLEKSLSNVFKRRSVVSIEVTILPGDQFAYSGVQLSIKKGLCVMEHTLPHAKEVGEVLAVFNNDIPVSLSLSGRGILHKKLTNPSGDDQKDLENILPNAKREDFYIQKFPIQQDVIFSLVRKQVLHDLLNLFKKSKLTVTHVVLGGFSVEGVLPLMKLEATELILGGHAIKFNNASISDYRYEKGEYQQGSVDIDGERIPENLLVAYATGIQTLSGIDSLGVAADELASERSEHVHKRFFTAFGTGVLIFFLAILIVNFFLFNHYNARYIQLSGSQIRFSDEKESLDSVSRKIAARQSFLNTAGWMKPSRVSYYADEIGGSVPPSILLTELAVNPYQEQSTRAEKKIVFDPDKIVVTGTCNRPTDLNPWIQSMKHMPWVNAVEIQNYTFDNSSGKGKFIITLTIK